MTWLVNRSFSQLSITQENVKKKKTTTTNQSNNQILKVVNGDNQGENDESVSMHYAHNIEGALFKSA